MTLTGEPTQTVDMTHVACQDFNYSTRQNCNLRAARFATSEPAAGRQQPADRSPAPLRLLDLCRKTCLQKSHVAEAKGGASLTHKQLFSGRKAQRQIRTKRSCSSLSLPCPVPSSCVGLHAEVLASYLGTISRRSLQTYGVEFGGVARKPVE